MPQWRRIGAKVLRPTGRAPVPSGHGHPTPSDRAWRRARWLGELAQALDQANRLLFRLREVEESGGEAALLHARILALRAEINALQRGGKWANEAFRPKRVN